jgi:hypothetical protein
MAYAAELDSIITGGEDAAIHVHQLSGPPRTFNDVMLPTSFTVRYLMPGMHAP